MADNDVLHTKYRPKKFADVIGQDAVLDALQDVIDRRSSRSFLLTGPSGVGKTTIARIGARVLGCKVGSLIEVDAATRTGIDDVRLLQEQARYQPIGGGSRAIIMDEAHRMTKQAWEALLKSIEEPPDHLSWWFCTTEPGRILPTIKTRCTSFALRLLSEEDLTIIFDKVVKAEGIKISDGIAQLVIRQAGGSPRQMLVNLAICRDLKSVQEAKVNLQAVLNEDPVRKLAQFVINGKGSWPKAMQLVEGVKDEDPESVRIAIVNYINTVLDNATTDDAAIHALSVLEQFSTPYDRSTQSASLKQSIGRVLYSGG